MSVETFEIPTEVEQALQLALERKASDLVVLDLRGISTATDYFVIASGVSEVQIKAIADHVIEDMKKAGVRPAHVEGMGGGRWVLIDYIDFVVHVFHPSVREFYQLESLWGDAPRQHFEE